MPDTVQAVVLDLERYEELLEIERWLNCLDRAGLSEFEYLKEARDLFHEDKENPIYE